MKHKLTLLASLIAIAGGLMLSVNAHRAAVQQQLVLDAKAAASHIEQAAKQKAAELEAAHQTQAELSQLQAQCRNGLAAYNLLTPSQRTKAIMPNCSLPLQ